MFPNCSIAPPASMIPALTKPIKAIKRPIPTLTAYFKLIGIESMIASHFRKDILKIYTSTNTAAKANCSYIPGRNRKKEFSPNSVQEQKDNLHKSH